MLVLTSVPQKETARAYSHIYHKKSIKAPAEIATSAQCVIITDQNSELNIKKGQDLYVPMPICGWKRVHSNKALRVVWEITHWSGCLQFTSKVMISTWARESERVGLVPSVLARCTVNRLAKTNKRHNHTSFLLYMDVECWTLLYRQSRTCCKDSKCIFIAHIAFCDVIKPREEAARSDAS